jgi:hypothetical protein
MTGDADFERITGEQARLRADIELVSRYGEEHPEDFGGLMFENGDPVRIVVAFSRNIARHEQALRQQVEHPDCLEVRHQRFSASELEEIRAEVERVAKSRTRQPLMAIGSGFGVVSVRLRPDEEALAAELHGRFGNALELTVGALPYPRARKERHRPPPPAQPTRRVISGLVSRIELDPPEVAAGNTASGRVVLGNTGSEEISLQTGQPLVASLVDPETGEVVGGYVSAVAGTGLSFRISPGAEARVPLLVGTASYRTELGNALPPGRYIVRTQIPLGAGREVVEVADGVLTVTPPGPSPG